MFPEIYSASQKPSSEGLAFKAQHPMFLYQTPEIPESVKTLLSSAKEIVIVGLGGSILPLKSLFSFHPRYADLKFLDTVDSQSVGRVFNELTKPLFCVVSKSGETLEIQQLLKLIMKEFPQAPLLVVTDRVKGRLRSFAKENSWCSLEIPEAIGGRFTHFSAFHRALAESWGVDFQALQLRARQQIQKLQANPDPLAKCFSILFSEGVSAHVLWAYGSARKAIAQWMQQALGESLGKINHRGLRCGKFPIVLEGPQDQHSILQLLMDGPQTNALWFLSPPARKGSSHSDLEKSLWVLAESTFKSFEERLAHSDTAQSLLRSSLNSIEEAVDLIVFVQAFVEYAGERLELNAFDQPGVERGKQIARQLIQDQNS